MRKLLIFELRSGHMLLYYKEIEAGILPFFPSLYTKIPGKRIIPLNFPGNVASRSEDNILITPSSHNEIWFAIKVWVKPRLISVFYEILTAFDRGFLLVSRISPQWACKFGFEGELYLCNSEVRTSCFC